VDVREGVFSLPRWPTEGISDPLLSMHPPMYGGGVTASIGIGQVLDIFPELHMHGRGAQFATPLETCLYTQLLGVHEPRPDLDGPASVARVANLIPVHPLIGCPLILLGVAPASIESACQASRASSTSPPCLGPKSLALAPCNNPRAIAFCRTNEASCFRFSRT
jgi:hypothetical protein